VALCGIGAAASPGGRHREGSDGAESTGGPVPTGEPRKEKAGAGTGFFARAEALALSSDGC